MNAPVVITALSSVAPPSSAGAESVFSALSLYQVHTRCWDIHLPVIWLLAGVFLTCGDVKGHIIRDICSNEKADFIQRGGHHT